jgi:hypothetical protein
LGRIAASPACRNPIGEILERLYAGKLPSDAILRSAALAPPSPLDLGKKVAKGAIGFAEGAHR